MKVSIQKQQYRTTGLNMKLLKLIEKNAQTKEEIANELGILESTARARICEMLNKQITMIFEDGKKKYKTIVTESITKPVCPRCNSANSFGKIKELVCMDCGRVFSKEGELLV